MSSQDRSAAQRHRRLEFHDPSNPDCRFSADPGVASPDADWCSCPIPEQPAAQAREVYAFVWSFLICYAAGLLGAFGWGRHWNAYLCLLLTLGSVVLWATFVTAWRNRLGR